MYEYVHHHWLSEHHWCIILMFVSLKKGKKYNRNIRFSVIWYVFYNHDMNWLELNVTVLLYLCISTLHNCICCQVFCLTMNMMISIMIFTLESSNSSTCTMPAVLVTSSFASILAPLLRSSLTTPSRPRIAAKCRAVWPF